MNSSKRKGDGRLMTGPGRENPPESDSPLFPRSMNGMTGTPVVCECISNSKLCIYLQCSLVRLTGAVHNSYPRPTKLRP